MYRSERGRIREGGGEAKAGGHGGKKRCLEPETMESPLFVRVRTQGLDRALRLGQGPGTRCLQSKTQAFAMKRGAEKQISKDDFNEDQEQVCSLAQSFRPLDALSRRKRLPRRALQELMKQS